MRAGEGRREIVGLGGRAVGGGGLGPGSKALETVPKPLGWKRVVDWCWWQG